MGQENNQETDWAKVIADAVAANTGGSSIPVGGVSPASRTAIGVKGTATYNVSTGEKTGYTGYTIPGSAQSPYGRSGMRVSEPQYFSGDEDMIGKMGRDSIANLQYQMVQNGIMSSGYTPGVVDDKTRSSFRELLGMANTMGTDYVTALGSVSQARQQAGVGNTGLRTYQISNPDDLRVVFRKAAQDLLGRNLDDGDLNKLISTFQAQEEQYSRKAQGGGGVVTAAPNAQTFAQTQIQKDFGEEVDTQKMDTLFSNIDQMLSKGK